jgi:predicted CoA-substrate-specific enzyme activase
MDSLGICLGASTISLARLRNTNGNIETIQTCSRPHEGNPRRILREMLSDVEDLTTIRISATGRKFRKSLNLSTISEPEAVELACRHLLPAAHPYRVVVSAGGETFMVYHLDDDGRIQNIHTGNKCASGTGEFFLQQIGRMSLSLDELENMEMSEKHYQVSGRCSVFCKSDCTHALNKGIPKPQVVAGLSRMMAGKVLELIKKLPKEGVMLIGGCTANVSMIHYLQKELENLYIPDEAPYFEALGAALWGLNHPTQPVRDLDRIFGSQRLNISYLRPLEEFKDQVDFKEHPRGTPQEGDRTILGLDVGSTTTKGVIMRREDKAILAADYLRTNGDPVGAARLLYRNLAEQLHVPIVIEGLGVTGSGRQIAGLHAGTEGIVNEIIAHAAAAVHFDPQVDTIFEIGGQDAKYTSITNGVPSDYAMNEACSAGTGSFLEESAKESLGLDVTSIGDTAYLGKSPPNFNDQCAAFIGSDIKSAAQEGLPLEDIVAGLVYSICMNYINRVKGNRPVGKKVFIQGGVCYNRAVPAAMAALTGKEMVVPPEPGLMGAFGVALEIERRMEKGILPPGRFDLEELTGRDVTYKEPFRCNGDSECDRTCEISRIEVAGKTYPFGGICNRFDTLLHTKQHIRSEFDLVVRRERRAFRDLAPESATDLRPTVGMNRSFQVNSYFPLFNRFFAELGFRLVLPDHVDPEGVDHRGAPFCYPVELAHGYFADLLARNPDFLFVPHLMGMPGGDDSSNACTCPLVQGEPFYLRTAFQIDEKRMLAPTLDFSRDIPDNLPAFENIARSLKLPPSRAREALKAAIAEQEAFFSDLKQMGEEAIAELEKNPNKIGVVLFGRSYNSFVQVANKGIPAKFAARGIRIIPVDMVPYQNEPLAPDSNMFWASGQMILRGARYVERHPQLFGTYITNFSCGPDSFLLTYFRDIMGRKPSLTLELDSHTADAGVETRIEAFLDIVRYHRQLKEPAVLPEKESFRAAQIETVKERTGVRTSDGRWVPLTDPQVNVVIPAMGKFGTALFARAFARCGVNAVALPPADEEILKIGRGNSSCKECLPLQTTIGSMINYLNQRPAGEITAYFMPSDVGPCRFGQYHVFSKRTIEKHRIPDVAVLTLTPSNGYGGLGPNFTLAAWRAVVIGDIFDEIWPAILAGAKDREKGLAVLDREYQAVMKVIAGPWRDIARALKGAAEAFSRIELKKPYGEIPKISLIGEIYVRHDPISLQGLIERLADRGFILRKAPTSEWIKYTDWAIRHRISGKPTLAFWGKYWVKKHFDRQIRRLMAPSGLFFHGHSSDVEPVIAAGERYISPNLAGEAILTIGSALHDILEPACGVISIGPFGCMPTRLSESILNEKFTTSEKRELMESQGEKGWSHILETESKLPFLAIETDGNPFPQLIEARLEAFCLQAQRLNEAMLRKNQMT